MSSRHFLLLLSLSLLPFFGGCNDLSFYAQGARGQWQLWSDQVPVADLLADPQTDPHLRTQLELAMRLREFAAAHLDLPVDGQFSGYIDLQREAVVWAVVAAPPLSLQAHQWCYPVVGCQSYRGYFAAAGAYDEAARLQVDGLETWVGAVPAYSTLGWLDDPLLNTFIRYPDAELAGLIFHELAHQIVYVKDDTEFNESFATAVETEGVRRWLADGNGGPDAWTNWQQKRIWQEQLRTTLARYHDTLTTLYEATGMANDEKLRERARIFDELRMSLQQMSAASEATKLALNRWTTQPINNARLAAVTNYLGLTPAFTALLQLSPDLPAFYAQVRELGELPDAERRAALNARAGLSSAAP